ncbi:MAG: hypothetical protein KDE31_37670, partial [Caldilineaceae bacterium]|nr:hypothetical protein [Caldilineaceae bacterium]
LAELFSDTATAAIVVADAGIDSGLLELDGSPLVIWQNILTAAQRQSKVEPLLAIAHDHYPNYAPLTAAIAHYRTTPAPSSATDLAPDPAMDASPQSVFNRSGQTVNGPQTNIAGSIHITGGILNTGILYTGPAPTQPDLVAELDQLISLVTQAGQQGHLDDDTTIDIEAALRKALAQGKKPQRDSQLILTHLTTAQQLITAGGQAPDNTAPLIAALTHAIALVCQAG